MEVYLWPDEEVDNAFYALYVENKDLYYTRTVYLPKKKECYVEHAGEYLPSLIDSTHRYICCNKYNVTGKDFVYIPNCDDLENIVRDLANKYTFTMEPSVVPIEKDKKYYFRNLLHWWQIGYTHDGQGIDARDAYIHHLIDGVDISQYKWKAKNKLKGGL